MPVKIESEAPSSLEQASLKPRGGVYPSPADWGDQVLYFLLPDRFSDGNESTRPLYGGRDIGRYTHSDRRAYMQAGKRYAGGNLRGLAGQLPYIRDLGITTLWFGPVWKQRYDLQTYHGYGIQNFLDVDPRLGTRQDLRDLIDTAHDMGMYVLLDIIYNHTGNNWFYDDHGRPREALPFRNEPYPFHGWRSKSGNSIQSCAGHEDGVWPVEFQNLDWYSRCGTMSRWDHPGKEFDRDAEFRKGDFSNLKDLKLERDEVLDAVVRVYEYWIALSDCDGFRIDTVKHVPLEVSAIFCHDIRTFARRLGKSNFMLLGEVTGGAELVRKYVDPDGPNLDCVLDIHSVPKHLAEFVKGLCAPCEFFKHFGSGDDMGDIRELCKHHVSILDDHDMVWRKHKERFAHDNKSTDLAAQVAHAVGVQLTTPGIPCIYYGTEQCFDGSESLHDPQFEALDEHGRIPDADRYIRECMFGGEFGAFVTRGCHFFDINHPAYRRIAAITRLRNGNDSIGYALRRGKLLLPDIRTDQSIGPSQQGGIVVWLRKTQDKHVIIALNTHGDEHRGADICLNEAFTQHTTEWETVYRSDWSDQKLTARMKEPIQLRISGKRAFLHIQLPPAGMIILA